MSRSIAWAVLALTASPWSASPPAFAQQSPVTEIVGHTTGLSRREVSLEFQLADGNSVRIALREGRILLDDQPVGAYLPAGPLESTFREVLSRAGRLSSAELLAAVKNWEVTGLSPEAASGRGAILKRLEPLSAHDLPVATGHGPRDTTHPEELSARGLAIEIPELYALPELADRLRSLGLDVRDGQLQLSASAVRLGDRTVAADEMIDGNVIALEGDVSVHGHVTGDVVAVRGDVVLHRRSVVDGDVVALGGSVINADGRVGGEVLEASLDRGGVTRVERIAAPRSAIAHVGSGVMGLLGAFVALAAIGFGITLFAPRELEVVSDTLAASFGRAFLAGVFAHPLVPMTFALLMLGLLLTVIGIVAMPFAAIGFGALVVAATVGGYLAVARTAGEIYLRRRMARGEYVGSANPYRFVVYGIGALLLIWVPAVFLGWVPVIGGLFSLAAVLITWALVTAGFGAVVLSRGGIRGTFARRFTQQLSDEYLWMTPQATPIARPRDREVIEP